MNLSARLHLPRLACALLLACASVLAPVPAIAAAAQGSAQTLPSFAELEAAGARVGAVHIRTGDIFDTDDPNEDKALFRWANRLHIKTRPAVIERALLFKTGDLLSVRLIDETERLLRNVRYLYDVAIRPVAWRDGVVDLEVETRDTWTLDPGISVGRSGGANSSGLSIREYNLLGSGVSIGLGRNTNVDRSSNEFQFSNDRIFGSRVALSYNHAQFSDGRRNAASIVRPFYALDARWSAGLSATKDDRLDAIYSGGKPVAQYRHSEERAELFGGWSAGLQDGWVRRYAIGVQLQDDAYAPEPGYAAPAGLPADRKLVSPFVRFELLEDRFEKLLNRNLIGRPEFFALGLASTMQLGWAGTRLGSTQNSWLYSASLSRGFEPAPDHTLITATSISGQLTRGQVHRQRLNAQAQYYWPQGKRWLFYASASGDLVTRPDPADALLLGGDNGLRGFPLRYQSGHRRALFTVEERFYTDLYVWRLFRVGGAAYVDVGRAWGGPPGSNPDPGWLSNAGLGLRIVSARAAFSTVLHLDLAFPVNAPADVKKTQLLVKTRSSF